MITLYIKKNDIPSEQIQSRLEDMVLSHQTIEINDTEQNRNLPDKIDLPAIKENGTLVSGKENLEKYLHELEQQITYSRSLSGDGCYYDPDTGKLC